MKYAQVIISIPTRQIDRPFDYAIPQALEAEVQLGTKVEVPFGSKTVEGYVVGLNDSTKVDPEKIKTIRAVAQDAQPIPLELLKLATWLASFYQCLYLDALRLVLPAWTQTTERKVKTAALASPISEEEVAQMTKTSPKQAAILKALSEHGPLSVQELIELADCTAAPLHSLAKKGKVQLALKPQRRHAMAKVSSTFCRPTLTGQQKQAIETLAELPEGGVGLLWGITGSGKTEVYLNLIQQKLDSGKAAITLVPEIALTPQMVARYRSRFGDQVAVLHSQLGAGERRDEWERVRTGEARVVLGPRSALFAPIDDLGLIIIDEEHEPSYKQEAPPRYHARECAIKRAEFAGAQVVLGSATPSLESFYKAQRSDFQLVSLTQRPTGQKLPQIQLVDMRQELKDGNRSMFSWSLQESLKECLAAGQQAILFLNRRGYSTTVLCRECGQAVRCPKCDLPLTFHFNQHQLRCHYCDYHRLPPGLCPNCGSKRIRHFGTGTEKVEAELGKLFPGAKIARMDVDTTRTKGSHERILGEFRKGSAQILVGTQMVAKGLDFPNVTLVGVVMADLTLNLPDFRAAERTFQLLTQVAGRAGRGERPGKVLIQSYLPEHYSIQAAARHDYLSFFNRELPYRKRQAYPPFSRLVNITVSGREAGVAFKIAKELAGKLTGSITGPLPAPFALLRGEWRYRIMARFRPDEAVPEDWLEALTTLNYTASGVKISVDVDPVSML
ncbi:MAG: primosomal protein N' [Firmicutes bacterium]|mgnify:CR=1 FL=1|nr:primosomal protein N' [Bacillota bacterium]HQD39729.1 primosomal protein N' [Bacillota bacterium]